MPARCSPESREQSDTSESLSRASSTTCTSLLGCQWHCSTSLARSCSTEVQAGRTSSIKDGNYRKKRIRF